MSSHSTIITPARAHELAHNNLLRVFSERDSTKRDSIIPETYTKDAVVYEPDNAILHGHAEINKKVSELLTERAGWNFTPIGEVKLVGDFVYLKWGFSPPGSDGQVDVKATGADHFVVKKDEDGKVRIATLYVVTDGLSDVKL